MASTGLLTLPTAGYLEQLGAGLKFPNHDPGVLGAGVDPLGVGRHGHAGSRPHHLSLDLPLKHIEVHLGQLKLLLGVLFTRGTTFHLNVLELTWRSVLNDLNAPHNNIHRSSLILFIVIKNLRDVSIFHNAQMNEDKIINFNKDFDISEEVLGHNPEQRVPRKTPETVIQNKTCW